MLNSLFIIAFAAYAFYLLYKQASAAVWAISTLFFSLLLFKFYDPGILLSSVSVLFLSLFILLSIKPLRRLVFSRYIMKAVEKALPNMSSTEREALEAGTVSWEGELFTGKPDFKRLRSAPVVSLSPEEQAFIDGPVDELCRMINDWDITHNLADMPQDMWQFIRKNGFLGMIIPKKFGGLEFSATAQMIILSRLYGRSITVATTVGVPNSLGPAELLLKYGTEEQKNYYLPRLADGREIPCFALTGPNAGSDAASIPDTGIVCQGSFKGETVLGVRLNFDKRYITLAPIATVVGLAFRLLDPDGLLGQKQDIGISCALIPADTEGMRKGRRHFPLNTAFLNGPIHGKDVFIPMDYLIGGAEMAGKGWRMLMNCLSAGRAISLPSSANGGAQFAAMATGAYAAVRRQFNQPIARFEGIEEALARITGYTYIIDASLRMTAAAIDHGAKPAVAGAILKYHCTEMGRLVAIDAMDVHGGKGICLGPKNYIGRGYQGMPIGITVEGANILTRSLIIYGQGAIRCHPYVFKEMETVRNHDLKGFDEAFFAHTGFVFSNLFKSVLFSFTDARGTKTPASSVSRYYQLVHRYSTNLAFVSDYCMAVMGSSLKRKEKISARLGDMLSTLYLISAVLKRFHEDHEPEADLPVVDWACQKLLFDCEEAMTAVITNIKPAWARGLLKLIVQPFGRRRQMPLDDLGHQLATILSTPNESRDRLTAMMFKEDVEHCPAGKLERLFYDLHALADVEKTLVKAAKEGRLSSLTFAGQIEEARRMELISAEEANKLADAEKLRQEIIAVDDFSSEALSHASIKLHLDTKKHKSDTQHRSLS